MTGSGFLYLVRLIVIAVMLASAASLPTSAAGRAVDPELQNPPAGEETPPPPLPDTPYFESATVTTKGGESLDVYTINGPSTPPNGYEAERQASSQITPDPAMASKSLPVPSYDWTFGCSATSGSMIAAYYDRNGFPNMYTGPYSGGVMPLQSDVWPYWTDGTGYSYAQVPLAASHQGLDGRTTRGSIDDYWVGYGSSSPDPYITGNWTQHAWGTAIGDFMKTSQSAYSNPDGATKFYTYTSSSAALTCDTIVSAGYNDDGTVGRRQFYQARGYTVTDCYNQKTDNNGGGFTYALYRAEIDAGRPVMLNLAGHTVVGYGYSDPSTIYIRDTWDYNYSNVYSMPWGGSYQNMALLSVSIVNLATTSPCYTLGLNANPGGAGTIAASPTPNCDSGTRYTPGTSVSLTASPTGSYTFSNWSGDASGISNPVAVVMNANKNVTANFAVPGPTITGFSPTSGNVGATVTITGTNFTGATAVKFNGTTASFNIVSATSITTTVPAGATTGSLSVTTPGGTATSSSNFTVIVPPKTLYAKPAATGTGNCLSWANACILQTALGAAVSGDEIWVMKGTHKPSATSNRAETFHLKSGVGIYGGFAGSETARSQRNFTANVTILSGDLNGNDNSNVKSNEPTRAENTYHVVTGSGTDSTAILDGFSVTGGNAETGQGCPGTGCGAGMENTAGSPTVANVIFAGNSVNINGGAMSNMSGSSPALTNVTFDRNTSLTSAGGAIFNHTSSLSLTNVTFSNNWSYYQGGAIYNHDTSPALTNVTFINNSSDWYGGAIFNYTHSSPTLINVTFTGNTAPDGSAIYNTYASSPTIRNSILWGNDILNFDNSGGSVTISDSVISGGCPAGSACSNVISFDPMLGTVSNYGGSTQTVPLLPGSTAFNTGNASYCPTKDQRGLSRYGNCDMGAFESQGFTLAITGGNNQTASINTAFAVPLQVSVSAKNAGEPVNGGVVSFMGPTSGASVVNPSQSMTISGGSASANETANGTPGSYQVAAYVASSNTVIFNLTNTNPSTTTQLTSTPNPSVFGQTVLFTATVTAAQGTPTGTVTFYDNGVSLGSGTLNASRQATLSISTFAVGAHTKVTAQYAGDASFTGSISSDYTHTVNKAGTTITLTSAPNPSTFGQTVTLTATVTTRAPGAGTPTGTVTFYDDSSWLGSSPLNSSGKAVFSISTLSAGTHSKLTAQYAGDANFTGSTSASYSHTVEKASTTTNLASAPNPSFFGQMVTLTATIFASAPGGGMPTGTVTFYDNGANLGSSPVATSGKAVLSISTLAVGNHMAMYAQYAGDVNFNGSKANSYSHTVSRANTTTDVDSSPNPSVYGEPVTLTALVAVAAPGAGTPTGTVTFYDGETALGTISINSSGIATFTLSNLTVGSHNISARYGSDSKFSGSTSAVHVQVVGNTMTFDVFLPVMLK